MTLPLFARAIRGLEPLAAAEIARIGTVGEIGHREVHFTLADGLEPALGLGSVDDVFLTAGWVEDVGHTREALDVLSTAAPRLGVREAVERARALRPVDGSPSFDVAASFLGARNYNRFEIEDALGGAIAGATGWRYVRRRDEEASGEITVRAHLRDGRALVGVRLGDVPLHRRAYKTESPRGSLHPPVAYAMAMLAELRPGHAVLDPVCGAGTIPIEASRSSGAVRALASDLDPNALAMASRNAARANVSLDAFAADAARLPMEDGAVDRVLANVPWGRSVTPKGSIHDIGRFWAEIHRVLGSNGLAVVLGEGLAADDAVARFPLSLMGAHPEIVVRGAGATFARSLGA